jgi:hypothetical protein
MEATARHRFGDSDEACGGQGRAQVPQNLAFRGVNEVNI